MAPPTRPPPDDFFDDPRDNPRDPGGNSGFTPWDDEGNPDAAPDPEKDAGVQHRARMEMGLPALSLEPYFDDPLGERPWADDALIDEETGEPLADIPGPPPMGQLPNPNNPNHKYENIEVDPETNEPFRIVDGERRKVRRKGWIRVMEPTTRARFLAALEKFGTWVAAADAVGAGVGQCRFYAKTIPAFGAQCKAAMERYAAGLREEAWRRAVKGVKKPIMGGKFKDEVVGWETTYSDNLLMMLVKGTDKTMSEKHLNVHHDGQVNHAHVHLQIDPQKVRALPKEERNQLRQLLDKLRPDPSPSERLRELPPTATNRERLAALHDDPERVAKLQARDAAYEEAQRAAAGRAKDERRSHQAKAGQERQQREKAEKKP